LQAYHDADDEPSSEPLDPNYFEFDLVKEVSCGSFDESNARLLMYSQEISKPELKRAFFRRHLCTLYTDCTAELLYEEVMSFVPAI
jgi:hypothetical protein